MSLPAVDRPNAECQPPTQPRSGLKVPGCGWWVVKTNCSVQLAKLDKNQHYCFSQHSQTTNRFSKDFYPRCWSQILSPLASCVLDKPENLVFIFLALYASSQSSYKSSSSHFFISNHNHLCRMIGKKWNLLFVFLILVLFSSGISSPSFVDTSDPRIQENVVKVTKKITIIIKSIQISGKSKEVYPKPQYRKPSSCPVFSHCYQANKHDSSQA